MTQVLDPELDAPDAPEPVSEVPTRKVSRRGGNHGGGRPVGSQTTRDGPWRSRILRLRKKVLDGETLTTDEVESILLWKALGLVGDEDEARSEKGMAILTNIYETRSKARLAPGNAPAKQKPTGAAAKYGVEAPERASPKASEAVDESPRGWIPDQA